MGIPNIDLFFPFKLIEGVSEYTYFNYMIIYKGMWVYGRLLM